ncbi:MAG: hypothetical protein JNK56_34735 [Myxococcales bacterium]|nr:hypothetical protein [Myxococcales bacterium]
MGELGADLGEGFGERAAGVGREQLGEIGAAAAGVEAALAGQRELAGAGLRGEQPDLAEHLAGGDPVARAVGGVAGVAAGGPREQERGAGGPRELRGALAGDRLGDGQRGPWLTVGEVAAGLGERERLDVGELLGVRLGEREAGDLEGLVVVAAEGPQAREQQQLRQAAGVDAAARGPQRGDRDAGLAGREAGAARGLGGG